jgi:3-(3-hydroxy-phenyl)propionate hydroxylase
VWRIDFQLGWDADPEAEKQPERIKPRVDAMMRQALGREVPFELEWASVYTFACLRMDSFRHGRVLFAGDSAHGVSPFGARGANSGVQDAENLAWKLDLVLRGTAPPALLDSYATEREAAADENILNSTRATDFITPKSEISRLFRDATLHLARHHAFARRIVNSGRLSVPATLRASPLNTPDAEPFHCRMVPGAPAVDAPLVNEGRPAWLLRLLSPTDFTALVFDGPDTAARVQDIAAAAAGLVPVQSVVLPCEGPVAERYDARPGTTYLLRPDQHVCARWRHPDATQVGAALRRALARG